MSERGSSMGRRRMLGGLIVSGVGAWSGLAGHVLADPGNPSAPSAPPDVAAAPASATRTPSGLAYRFLRGRGGGAHPGATDRVRVHYTGWQTDGTMFDSSVTRGRPAEFPLNRVIAGWTEAVQLMSPGDALRVWIPESLAYQGRSGAPSGMLVFDIELLAIVSSSVPATPSNVAAPPAQATRTASGLAYLRLRGDGRGRHPSPSDRVRTHYTGWQTDGTMFDSSLTRGRPAEFPLNAVIPGWTEALQLMSPGDRLRVWIPESLAYAGRPGRPAGMLVFDIELLAIL